MLKVILVFLTIFAFNTLASTEDEIAHLLGFVETTKCTYERNGTMHTGKDAVKHISQKYEHFKDDIHSAEDFIKYSATKSTMSGKFYRIHCDGLQVVNSQDWLLTELANYRTTHQ